MEEVVKVSEVENTYVIKWKNCSAIIKDGKIANGEVMSSGTKAGLEISYIITSLLCDMHDLYYCDELLSYEKAIVFHNTQLRHIRYAAAKAFIYISEKRCK